MAFLLVVTGSNEGDFHPLETGTVTVGRDEECTIQLLDEAVSRRHMLVRCDGPENGCRADDDDSANGVFINNRQISGETPLVDGDIIRIGESELIFSERDFIDQKTALEHYGRRPQRDRSTMIR